MTWEGPLHWSNSLLREVGCRVNTSSSTFKLLVWILRRRKLTDLQTLTAPHLLESVSCRIFLRTIWIDNSSKAGSLWLFCLCSRQAGSRQQGVQVLIPFMLIFKIFTRIWCSVSHGILLNYHLLDDIVCDWLINTSKKTHFMIRDTKVWSCLVRIL